MEEGVGHGVVAELVLAVHEAERPRLIPGPEGALRAVCGPGARQALVRQAACPQDEAAGLRAVNDLRFFRGPSLIRSGAVQVRHGAQGDRKT